MANAYTPDALRILFQSSFNLEQWYSFLQGFFHVSELKEKPERIIGDSADEGYYLGSIDTTDSYRIGLFHYKIKKGSVVNKRVGLRNLVKSFINPTWGEFDAALVVFDDGNHWRLSFISDLKGDSTAPKRYTFVFGEAANCYNTAVSRFVKLQGAGVSFSTIKEAFSVEALNKEFFDKYREHYADFVQYITGKRYVKQGGKWIEKLISEPHVQLMAQFIGDEKRVRDYIKKLLGRIVFLHYLQRKGWLGVPDGKNWGEGDTGFMQHLLEFATPEQKENFVEVVLEPLFYGALNTDRTVEGDLFNTGVNFPDIGTTVRIPYLNGGLFEQDENDLLTVKFPSEYFARLLDFFSQYNFTIDENDPNDAQVGVDPEMLGRIFESLLEDNKEKGAYYTPKEIVQYICRESLIAYLQTDIDEQSEARQAIADFVRSNDANCLLKYEAGQETYNLSSIVLERLKEVKICDPAIGSGAFPMGLLRELYHCRIALEELSVTPSEIKSQIIKNNIYGVDIEQGAVDIARLRFWLSLVVDEDMPHPLPNLDYKIMQGNSLLESYKGHDLSKILDSSNIVYPQEAELYLQFADDESSTNQILLRRKLEAYYGCHDSKEKQHLKNEIKDIINRQIENIRLEKGVQRALHEEVEAKRKKVAEQEVLDISNIDIMGNPYFFLWHTWFDDVFNRPSGRNGFDIVIGNPPYIRLKEISVEYKRIYRKAYPYTDNQFDIFSLFIQLGSNLLCSRGINSLIIPDSFIGRSNFASLRRVLLKQTQILVWLHLDQVFDVAKVASLIFVSQKKISEQERVLPYTKATNIENWLSGKKESYELKVSSILEREDCKVIAASAVQLSLWQKLETTIKFDNIFQVWRGEELGRKSPILNSDELDSYLPILAGEDVHRYQISVPTRWIDRKLVKKSLISYSKKKILIRQLGNRINATIDLNGSIVLQSVYCLTLRTEGVDDIWFYLGLCNSKLYDYIYQITTRDKQSFQRILIENIRTLPIPSVIDPEISQKISMFAKQILQNPKELSNSQQLDQLVYELYALTDEEIRLLENDE